MVLFRFVFFLTDRRPARSTRDDTLFPATTRFRSRPLPSTRSAPRLRWKRRCTAACESADATTPAHHATSSQDANALPAVDALSTIAKATAPMPAAASV